MTYDRTVGVAIDGPVIRMFVGDTLRRTRVVVQGPQFGRILFGADAYGGVQAEGGNLLIADNLFEFIPGTTNSHRRLTRRDMRYWSAMQRRLAESQKASLR